MIAEGTKLLLKCTFFHSRSPCQWPEMSRVKNRFMGWSGLPAMMRARRTSMSLGGGKVYYLGCYSKYEILMSLFMLVTVSMVKK